MTGWMEEYESRLFAFKTTTKIAAYVKSCTDAELMDDANNEVLFDRTFYKKLSIKLRNNENSILKVKQNYLVYIEELWTAISDYFILPPIL